jgi:transcriptional regulator with XRE-family HTH domain
MEDKEKKILSFAAIEEKQQFRVHMDLNVAILQKGYTQSQLAHLLGTKQSHISDWLRGKKGICEEYLLCLAKILEMDPFDLSRILKGRRDAYSRILKIRDKNKAIQNELEDLQKETDRQRVSFFKRG